ncbi:MAG TPA: helix-turn-helix transcriptional regulator [Actinophytocola sp.]|nr:helix-turn-helix transcriptional regulator [Actinophytocola sp.]
MTDALPARLLAASEDLGWTDVSARRYRDDPVAGPFTTAASPDLLVVLVTAGTYAIESHTRPAPVRAVYRPGSVGITAPGRASTLRWEALTPEPMESVHLLLTAQMLDRTAAELGVPRPGNRLDTLVADDLLLTGAATQLAWALDAQAPPLVADAAAQLLAAHVVGRRADRPAPPGLPPATLRRVVGHLHDRLAEEITLDDLAAVANLSKFHLLRRFRASTGRTPARFLTDLRTQRAALLLRTTDRPVATIAHQCGYRNPSQFAAAFRRRYGASPAAYRRARSG